jgi:hypothetical protein
VEVAAKAEGHREETNEDHLLDETFAGLDETNEDRLLVEMDEDHLRDETNEDRFLVETFADRLLVVTREDRLLGEMDEDHLRGETIVDRLWVVTIGDRLRVVTIGGYVVEMAVETPARAGDVVLHAMADDKGGSWFDRWIPWSDQSLMVCPPARLLQGTVEVWQR